LRLLAGGWLLLRCGLPGRRLRLRQHGLRSFRQFLDRHGGLSAQDKRG